MTKTKNPESEATTAETVEPMETTETMETGTGISAKSEPANTSTPSGVIEETSIEELPNISTPDTESNFINDENRQDLTAPSQEIETTAEDCETLYGVVMETAHGVVGKKKGKGHRGLPEARRKAQGKLLHNICQKYGITIPTEFELVIFGAALIADWQYMTVDEDEYAVSAAKPESTPVVKEDEPE